MAKMKLATVPFISISNNVVSFFVYPVKNANRKDAMISPTNTTRSEYVGFAISSISCFLGKLLISKTIAVKAKPARTPVSWEYRLEAAAQFQSST